MCIPTSLVRLGEMEGGLVELERRLVLDQDETGLDISVGTVLLAIAH